MNILIAINGITAYALYSSIVKPDQVMKFTEQEITAQNAEDKIQWINYF